MVRPNVPGATEVSADDAADVDPNLKPDLPQPPRLPSPHATPPRPRVASAPSTERDPNKGDVLVLAPQLSAEERANAQAQTNQSISVAEKNLASTRGRSLNATQVDLASKVRGFINDAREAARVGDWNGAQSLARKAEVLSEELVGKQ